jgi:carbamoyltransferase
VGAVLGIHAYSHEAGACVVTDHGVWAVSEERLSRRKYDGGFPTRAIAWAVAAAGLDGPGALELVVFDLLGRGTAPRVEAELRRLGFAGPVRACRHHDAHAASAWFPSPFDDAAVLVLDAGGTKPGDAGPGLVPAPLSERLSSFWEAQTQYRGLGNELRPIRRTLAGPPYTINPGLLYGVASLHLGFGPLGAGKVMGLAPFGRVPDGRRAAFFQDFEGDPLASSDGPFPYDDEGLRRLCRDRLFWGTPHREPADPLTAAHEELAAWVQYQTERAVLGLVRHLVAVTGCRRLCFSGGFALNVVTNRAILAETPVEELFVQPAATDSGIPLGCALWGWHVVLGRPRSFRMRTAALGSSYGPPEVEAALARNPGVRATPSAELAGRTARALADGAIVGWFQGRSEYGPRALGHRSILADPRRASSVRRLNEEIKHREPFRPYAPMVLRDDASSYFELPAPESPFMLLLAQVREPWRAELPAVTHVDGTARVQTVTPEAEPSCAALLERFREITGLPVLLNTSFNRAGEPIVESPDDALRMLRATGLDALVLEDRWVEKVPA